MRLNKKNILQNCTLLVLIIFSCIGCDKINVYEKSINIPDLKWQNNFNSKDEFNIEDTTVEYKIFLVLRHTDKYEYNNIWLNVGLQQANDTMQKQKLNIKLGSDADGWYGVGMNDIWEVRTLISQSTLKKGLYKFDIAQIMRNNPLLHIMNVGLRIEKVK